MATNEQQLNANLPVHVPTDTEIEAIRKKGAVAVAHSREVTRIANMLLGTEWGKGASEATRFIVAEFCKVVGAHPVYHVDILGGRAYLNANFWSDRINKDERFVDFEQRNISDDPDAKKHYAVPEWATHAYETIVRKLVPFAPIEKIRSGEITDWRQFVVETREAGWAGGKPMAKKRDGSLYDADPVGNADPAKSARTRSLRRTAARAFAAWMVQYEEQVKKAEDALEAEWEEIKPRKALRSNGPQALTAGSGEPTTAGTEPAQQLSVEDRTAPAAASTPNDASGAAPAFDARAAQQAYFGGLRDAGLANGDRKAWQVNNGLPASVTHFTEADFSKAMSLIIGDLQRRVSAGAEHIGFESIDELCAAWGVGLPETTRDLKDLLVTINGKIDEQEAAASGGQRKML